MMADYFASIPSVEGSVYAETTEMLRYAAEMAAKFEQTKPLTHQVQLGSGSWQEVSQEDYETMMLNPLPGEAFRLTYAAPQPAIPEGMKLVPVEKLREIEFDPKGYCPACSGWNVTPNGCSTHVHTKDCWLGLLIGELK